MAAPDVTLVPHVKGGSFPDTLAVLLERLGPQGFGRVMELVPPAFRDAHRLNSIHANVWYPLEWELALFRGFREIAACGLDAVADVGYAASMRQFTGLYRIFFRLLQPQTLLGKAGTIFSRFYSMGEHELLESHAGFARSRFVAPGFDANLWAEILGVCRAALELAGAKGIKLSFERGGKDGDNESVVVGTWEA